MRALAVIALLTAPAGAAGPPPEPAGYRLDAYRAPTPLTVAGKAAIDTAEAQRLWAAQDAVFIDVAAAVRRPAALPAGTIWSPTPHLDIPGSLWLPDSRPRRAKPGNRGLVPCQPRADRRGAARYAARLLLPGRLLDELERDEAGARLGLWHGTLVSRRRRWMAQGGLAARRGATAERRAALRRRPDAGQRRPFTACA